MIILLPKGLYVNKFDYEVRTGWAKDKHQNNYPNKSSNNGENNSKDNERDSVA